MRRSLLCLLTLLLTVGAWAELKQDAQGRYQLASVSDLQEFTLLVRAGSTGANAILTADIDMAGTPLQMPIGLYSDADNMMKQTYNGTFDGGGHVIRNLVVTQTETYETGLFGRAAGATIQNLGIINAKITNEAATRAGVLGGEMHNCAIRNCFTAGELEVNTDHEQAGGLAGEGAGSTTFTNCYTTMDNISPSIGGGTTNCYTSVEIEDMAKGELCYLLNGDQSDIHYYQNLAEDEYPTQDPTRGQVYAAGELNCDGTPQGGVTYTNSSEGSVIPPHDFDEDGYCVNCGALEGVIKPVDGWYNVTSAKELRYVSRVVNGGNRGIQIRLMNDIDMDGMTLKEPIGRFADNDGSVPGNTFVGIFDGQNHIIYNLTVTCDTGEEVGLFGRASGGAQIKNLGIVNATMTSNADIRAGVLGGELHQCTITNCFTAGDIVINTNNAQRGGIAGEAAASNLTNCYTTYEAFANAPGSVNNCYWGEDILEKAETGELCYIMNGKTFINPTWFQNIGETLYPVLDNTCGIVYKLGEEKYASAKTDAEFKELMPEMIAAEKEAYSEKVATQSLINNYLNQYGKLEGLSRAEFEAGYVNLNGLRDAISASEAAYANYEKKIADIKAFLEENTFVGAEADVLNEYLTGDVEPGSKFPNGSYSYIMENLQLSTSNITAETEYAQGLLDITIAKNYQAGTDITNMVVNADFSNELNGWTLDMGKPGIATAANYKNTAVLQDVKLDIHQTVKELRAGLYKVDVHGYAELNDADEGSAYNYNTFVYANGNKNYFHTKYTGLLTEEEKENYPNNFGAVEGLDGTLWGYGPGSYTDLCVAFTDGHYNNSIIVEVEDSLTLGVYSPGTSGRNTDTFFGNIHLTYLGNYSQAAEALDAQLENMVATADHIINDYEIDLANFGNAPSFSTELKEQLSKAMAAAQNATTSEDKYQSICKLGELFQAIYESKDAYLRMAVLNDKVYMAISETGSLDDADAWEADYYMPVITAYEGGDFTTQQALDMIEKLQSNEIYLKTYGLEPEKDKDGYYLAESPYNLIWISQRVNSDAERSLKFALVNDIDMSSIANFTPIGLHSDSEGIDHNFHGTFDGRGHVIKNLTVTVENTCEAGFFSRTQNATIRNVGFINANITQNSAIRAGVLGGELYRSSISNVFTTGDITITTDHEQANGIAGETAESEVNNSYTTYGIVSVAGNRNNCYGEDDVTGKLESGELCYQLNGNQKKIVFYQKLGEDKYPTLDSSRGQVFCTGTLNCDGTPAGQIVYTNEEMAAIVTPHEFDADGYCTVCGTDAGKSEQDEDGYYHLTNAYALRWFSNLVNSGSTNAKAVLDCDVDMTGIEMRPIGRYSDDHEHDSEIAPNRTWYGIFDGQGHEIKNLTIIVEDRYETGLFGRAGGGAQIKNVGMVNPTLANTNQVGVRLGTFVGELNGATISNCYVVGNISLKTSNVQLASFAGEAASGVIKNCYTTSELPFSYRGDHQNCYKGSEAAAIMETGELCYKLNGNANNTTWRQTLGVDAYPNLRETSKVVYEIATGVYSNEKGHMDTYAGTESDPIHIKTVRDMTVLRNYMKTGEVTYVVLDNDIDMSEVTDWVPLNTAADNDYRNWIDFNGQGHVIKGFTCTTEGQQFNSLFGVLCGGVKNLGLVDANVKCTQTGSALLAGWIGHNNYKEVTYVKNTYVTGKLEVTNSFCGGMFGHVGGEAALKNCYANVDITSTVTNIGGIIGEVGAALTIENTYAAGSNLQGHGVIGAKTANVACTYTNIAVWNNDYEDFGATTNADKLTGISYYNGENFAELQKAVVAWDPTTWSAEGNDYPILIATANEDAIQGVNANVTIAQNGVYTLTGVRVANTLRNLPKGLYIMNGKKVMVK